MIKVLLKIVLNILLDPLVSIQKLLKGMAGDYKIFG